MSGRYLYLKPRKNAWSPDPSSELVSYAATWRTRLASADRACCCPAKPMVSIVLPLADPDAEPAELLLCGHHYRVSREALAAAGAIVIDAAGKPVSPAPWPSEGTGDPAQACEVLSG